MLSDLSDSDSVRRHVEEMTADEWPHLFSNSRAMYVGSQNILENGVQSFEIWVSYVVSNLDEDERNDVKPQLHDILL